MPHSYDGIADETLQCKAAEIHNDGTASEVRLDVLSGRQTIFSSSRAERPVEFVAEISTLRDVGNCPFCIGNECLTPATLLAVDGEDEDESWLVRVVNNKYPAVSLLNPQQPAASSRQSSAVSRATSRRQVRAAAASNRNWNSDGNPRGNSRRRNASLFLAGSMAGGHEVIIESPRHTTSISELKVDHLTKVYQATAARIRLWRDVPEVQYVSVFKNVGARAGASLSHSHSQLIATAMLPPRIVDLMHRAGQHYDQTGCCLQCDMLRAESDVGDRIVFETPHLIAYCPYASSLPYLTRIVPRAHLDRFEDSNAAMLADLAQMTRRLVQCFESLFPGVAYNHVLHTRPPGAEATEAFHWSMEWMPRITTAAGFEHASDCFINPTFPETAAAQLRQAAFRLRPLRAVQPRTGYSIS